MIEPVHIHPFPPAHKASVSRMSGSSSSTVLNKGREWKLSVVGTPALTYSADHSIQQGNIRDVASLGVHCLYTPSGMTKATFDRGLQAATQSGRGGWTAFDATSPLRPEP